MGIEIQWSEFNGCLTFRVFLDPCDRPMTAPTRSILSIQYATPTMRRADRAMRCAPFQLSLFTQMVTTSVSLQSIAGPSGVQQRYTHRPLAELAVEAELLWLIQVGLLRREVDGQGLTDSFRVTPLGRQLIQAWSGGTTRPRNYAPSWGDRLYNALSRWLRVRIY
jgi:hypothetical protein